MIGIILQTENAGLQYTEILSIINHTKAIDIIRKDEESDDNII